MNLLIILFIINLVICQNPLVNVTHIQSNTILIMNSQVFNPIVKQNKKQICIKQKSFQNKIQQTYLIESYSQFKVKTFTKSTEKILITGVSESFLNVTTNNYQAQLIIVAKCRLHTEVIDYNMVLNITIQNNTFSLPDIQISLVCIQHIMFNKFEFILLQFLVSSLFIILNVIFTRLNSESILIFDIMIVFVLVICVFHKLLGILLAFLCITRFIYGKCINLAINRRQVLIPIIVSFSMSILVYLKNLQIYLVWFHYFENIILIITLVLVIKITRLRQLFLLWLIIYFFYDPFLKYTENHPDLQFYFPALSKLKPYSCVDINIMELILPLIFSVFFMRFSERHSTNKNLYMMFSFMSFLIVSVLTSIIELKDNTIRSSGLLNVNLIIIFGVLLTMIQKNFSRLCTFRYI